MISVLSKCRKVILSLAQQLVRALSTLQSSVRGVEDFWVLGCRLSVKGSSLSADLPYSVQSSRLYMNWMLVEG